MDGTKVRAAIIDFEPADQAGEPRAAQAYSATAGRPCVREIEAQPCVCPRAAVHGGPASAPADKGPEALILIKADRPPAGDNRNRPRWEDSAR